MSRTVALLRHPIACIFYLTTRCDGICEYCTVRSTVRNRFSRGIDAVYEKVTRRIEEFSKLGGRYVELTGGNPLFVPWLPEVLALCNRLGLRSSLSVCGPEIIRRLKDWGEKWISLPSLIRFSVDGAASRQDEIRGGGFHESICVGLKVSKRVRPGGTTQLALILVPGENGNINKPQLESVLKLSDEFSASVNLYPLFGTAFSKTKDRCDKLWKNLTHEERSDLDWLLEQPQVMEQSLDKMGFLLDGGNNMLTPSCRAGQSVISISPSDRIMYPCYHNPYNPVQIKGGLEEALNLLERRESTDQSGTLDGCDGCDVWCNDVMGQLHDQSNPDLMDYIHSGM